MKVKALTHVKPSRELRFRGSRHCANSFLRRCDVETFLSIGHLYADCAEEGNDWTGHIRQEREKLKSITEINSPMCGSAKEAGCEATPCISAANKEKTRLGPCSSGTVEE